MEINDNYAWKADGRDRKNNPLLPGNIRGLIVGNLLLQPDWLDYNHLYVFGKSLHQWEYKILRKGLERGLSKEQISNIFQNQKDVKTDPVTLIETYINQGGVVSWKIKVNFYNDCSMIPDPTELNDHEKNLLVLDDCLLEKQTKAEAYYTRGRHNNCDTFYIAQNYFRLPRQTIRENKNLLILFPQDAKNIAHIHADHCTDMDIMEFKEFCHIVWSKRYHFVTIDLSSTKFNGKYRENFDKFYFPTI